MQRRQQKFGTHQHQDHTLTKRQRIGRMTLGFLIFVSLHTLLFTLPLIQLLDRYQSTVRYPAPIGIKLLFCAAWALVVYMMLHIITRLMRKTHSGHSFQKPRNMFDDVMDALDQIAKGNYDVYVEREDRFLYSELADKINTLARDLSSVEQMRQEFISNVSHEIQSPLTSISGFASLLKKEELPEDRRMHYIDVIESESKRLSKLSDNLLRLSVLDCEQSPLVPSVFRLDKQLQNCLLMLEPQWAEKDIELDVTVSRLILSGDEELLSQVWTNLLHNAVKFTPKGGTITVSLAQEGEQACCMITDTGVGIAEESQHRIFERFYKADKARDRSLGGNGLGLSIVAKIVHLHQGEIEVNSRLGKGATFIVKLPLAQIPAKKEENNESGESR